jgi:hypothetical protein
VGLWNRLDWIAFTLLDVGSTKPVCLNSEEIGSYEKKCGGRFDFDITNVFILED